MDEQKLKDLLGRIDAPEPSKASQNQALSRALAEFDKKSQGNVKAGRLTDIHNKVRRMIMQKKYVLSGMAGAVSVIALVAVLGTPFIEDQMASVQLQRKPARDLSTPMAVEESKLVNGGAAADAKENMPVEREYANKADKAFEKKAMATADRVEAPTIYNAMPAPSSVAPEIQLMEQAPRQKVMGIVAPTVVIQDDEGQAYYKDTGRDKFEHAAENPVHEAATDPVSTFSIDVDTASYAFARKMINQGVLPQKDAVRVEEMINYFDYNYPLAETREQPFKPTIAVYDSPWKPGNKLVHIGVKGYDIAPAEKPRSNLVFLLDVSGSMNAPDKLPLLVNSLKLLVDNLKPEDSVAIVVYAGSAGTVLEPTKVSDKQKILSALENLSAGGSTAGAEGIRQAYNLAEQSFIKDGVNRVILATDGDFNVGITDQNELKSFIERKRETGIFLSVLGFGAGNYNDSMMQTLAQNGNGNAAYIDTLSEARRVLVQEASSTLFTIAKDVKIQVEFNAAAVKEYRLIGYETRALQREDFNNDKVDAGEIGSGHAVTAIYEITPAGAKPLVDDLRYAQEHTQSGPVRCPGGSGTRCGAGSTEAAAQDKSRAAPEYAFLKIRYKLPKEDVSKLIERPITMADERKFDQLSEDVRFAAAVAGFGQLLKGSKYTGSLHYDQIIEMANNARGADAFGYRAEFVNLVRLAKTAAAMAPATQQ